MNIDRLVRLLVVSALPVWGELCHAEEDFVPPLDAPITRGAEAAHQVAAEPSPYDWRLDTVIFTEISPVAAPDIAIKLPEDQREAH